MLVAVRKNCDRGLENAVRDRRPRAAFSSPSSRSQFFKIRSDPKPENNIVFFFSCGKFVLITNGFVYTTLALNRLACHLLTIWKTFLQPASNSDTKQRKCIKNENRFISNYFMLVAFSSPLKFFKTVFPVWKFEVVLGKQYLSVVANHLKSGFSQLFYPELNSRKRWNSLSVLHRNFLKNNNATIREVNSTEIDSFFCVKF